MSIERIVKALVGLGLTQKDVLVYIFLAKNGPQEEREITEILGFHVRQTMHSLSNLQDMEIVKVIGENPVQYFAIPFEEVIDLFIEVKKEQTKKMKEKREDLLLKWKTILKR